MLSGREDYKELLDENDVQNLKNLGGQVVRFHSLDDGETYTLGATKKQNDGKKSLRYICSFIIGFIQIVLC